MKVPGNARGRLDELDEELSEARDHLNRELALVRKRVTDLEEENEALRERVADLEDRVAVLEGQQRSEGKDARVAELVEFADNLRDDQRGAKLDIQDIMGATGVSRRYAYDLVEELPEEYGYVLDRTDVDQYGDLQIDDDVRGLFVDVEAAHRAEDGVNQFTTRTAEGGGR